MPVDTRRLRYFLRTAELGSISQAAKSFDIAQPALSHHITVLEQHLDVQLFIRGPRGVILTEAGTVFLRHAQQLVRAVDQAERETRDQAESVTGTIRLGLLNSVSSQLTPMILRAIRTHFPGITLHVMENSSDVLRRWIDVERLDLAVNLVDVAAPGAIPLMRDDFYFVGPPGSLDTGRGTIPFEDVVRHSLILPSQGHSLRKDVDMAAAQAGRHVALDLEVDGHTTLKSVVAEGIGHTILSWTGIHREVEDGKLSALRIVKPAIQRTLVLELRRQSPVTRALVEVGTQVVRSMAELLDVGVWQGKILMNLEQAGSAIRRHWFG